MAAGSDLEPVPNSDVDKPISAPAMPPAMADIKRQNAESHAIVHDYAGRD